MFYYFGKVRCWLSVTLKWELIRTGGILTLLSVLGYMGWWSVCGWPCRPAGVPRWRRRQHWAEADLLGGLETGTSDWHVPTCIETPAQIYIHIRQLWSEIRTDRRNKIIFWVGQYLILSVTPWGTPTLTVADRTLCRLIFLSAPYSTTVPNQPVLEKMNRNLES